VEAVVYIAEIVTLFAFAFILGVCIIINTSVLIALSIGLICFISYALYRKFTAGQIWQMVCSGVKEARTILAVFGLIGMLTALWRAGGTIPFIIYHTVPLITPRLFVMFTFLLCSLVSYLTGTAFGTVSTMGIICMLMGRTLGISDFYLGGAILSGIFFGDRCSPMSSSALLVCELTGTNIFKNIKNMIKTSILPFIFTVVFYAITGQTGKGGIVPIDNVSVFEKNFNLSIWVVLPALAIIILTVFRLDVKTTMICSIIAGVFVSMFFQGITFYDVLIILIFGYHSGNQEIAVLMDGGGIVSMVKTAAIVAISSSYFGIFRNTNLLDRLKQWIYIIARYSTSFATMLIVSVVTLAFSCNQTLATMLTYEITEKLVTDREKLAVDLENSVIIMCALIPWSIASAFPITTIGASANCLLYAVYLYAVPLWNLFVSFLDYANVQCSRSIN